MGESEDGRKSVAMIVHMDSEVTKTMAGLGLERKTDEVLEYSDQGKVCKWTS